LNGMALRYFDYNDYIALGRPNHASINVAPALAVAEMQGLTGKDLLLGIVVGYEVQLRLRDATEGAGSEDGTPVRLQHRMLRPPLRQSCWVSMLPRSPMPSPSRELTEILWRRFAEQR